MTRDELLAVFNQQMTTAENYLTAAQREPLFSIAEDCVTAFRKAHIDIQQGHSTNTGFVDSHCGGKFRTDLTRAISNTYGFTAMGKSEGYKMFSPNSIQVFESLKITSAAVYESKLYGQSISEPAHTH